MPQSPYLIHHLLVTYGDDPPQNVTVRGMVKGAVARGLGIWPEQVVVKINQPQRDLLPADLSTINAITLRIGLSNTEYVDIVGWEIVDVREAEWGSTTRSGNALPRVWDLYLEDSRSKLNGGRGGCLFDGLLNPVDPTGQIVTPITTCSALVAKCIDAIGVLTYREGSLPGSLIESLDVFDPPMEILWAGADAPVELQRLLEWTRHAFAFNQDGTYSIVKLVDPPTSPTAPDVGVPPMPSAEIAIKPNTPGKCIITSAPTRHLIERNRTLVSGMGELPMEFVGLDVDGSIAPLTTLSWWPSGKTAIEVFRNEYAAVAEEHRGLAEASIYRMFRLHADDIAEGWTFVSRLIDAAGDDPAKFILKSRAAREDNLKMWANPANDAVESGAQFDLRNGVITTPRPLVRVSGRTATLNAAAVQLGDDELDFTFGHHPSAGDYTDYFMSVFYFTGGGAVVGDDTPSVIDDALAEGVPVYKFTDLQVQYRETPGTPGPVTEVNLDEIKAIALQYATALLKQQSAKIQIKEYRGMHDVDPDGSVTRVAWVASGGVLRTVVHLGMHDQITSEYLQRVIASRASRGPGVGAAAARGNLMGVSRAASGPAGSKLSGPSSGARDGVTHAQAPAPPATRTPLLPFSAKITSQTPGTNVWTYGFEEVYKSDTGFGSSKWTTVSGGISGNAMNRFELINDATGANYLGIGVTNDELNDTANSGACALDLRPVPIGMIVQMWPEVVRKSDGTVAIEYLFTWANGVFEE
ncbi:MAG: hypothetical protein IT430_09900 [Phycisphaerales bacterium]|nr:hypothetical protein [Phycisphaerales bacterium]